MVNGDRIKTLKDFMFENSNKIKQWCQGTGSVIQSESKNNMGSNEMNLTHGRDI